MFGLKTQSATMLGSLAGVALCAMMGAAQSGTSTSHSPPTPAEIAIEPQSTTIFTSVTPQYNFAYGPSTSQPLLPSDGFWSDYMPLEVNASTPGWTTGEYGLQGIPQAFYNEPYYRGQSNYAGGCLWNEDYDSPPYWFYNSGGEYQLLSGPMLVAGGASIGTSYLTAAAPVAGSGVPVYGFGAMAKWDSDVYTSPPEFIETMNFTTNACNGATEYGFAHYPYYNPVVNQFYFDTNSNCPAPSGEAGSEACYMGTTTASAAAQQCQGAVNLPPLADNSQGNYWYLWYIYVSFDTANEHYLLNAGLQDPYTHASAWSCAYDVTANTFSNCPNTGTVAYACPSGSPFYAYPVGTKLYPGQGVVTVGVENTSNVPPAGGANPIMQMKALYILETAP
ncbi:MAG: hypothetical protein ABSG65_03370 [Bryobacteraceae bacterium]